MIRIDRKRVATPRVLSAAGAAGPRERKRAKKFYKDPKNAKAAFSFAAYKNPEVKDALNRLFHGKCAYCESRYSATQPMDVEHWKPKGAVEIQSGCWIHPGFYWLATEWDNLFPTCIDCNRPRQQDDGTGHLHTAGKWNQFPLAVTATPVATIEDAHAASPLLLNPCDGDDPADHLEFLDEGAIRPELIEGRPSARGVASIRVLALNRVGLALARREHALVILHKLDLVCTLSLILEKTTDEVQQGLLQDLISHELFAVECAQLDNQPYAQLTRQLVQRFAASLGIPKDRLRVSNPA